MRIARRTRASTLPSRSESDRIPECRCGRHAVLPRPTGKAAQAVNRPGRQHHVDHVRLLRRNRWIWAHAQRRLTHERYTNDVFKVGHIPMPAKRCAGTVLGNQHVDKSLRITFQPSHSFTAERLEGPRQLVCRLQPVVIKVISATKADDPAFCRVLLVPHRLHGQALDLVQPMRLFLFGEEARFVDQTWRQTFGGHLKQRALSNGGNTFV